VEVFLRGHEEKITNYELRIGGMFRVTKTRDSPAVFRIFSHKHVPYVQFVTRNS
jgi:hypothetical protein